MLQMRAHAEAMGATFADEVITDLNTTQRPFQLTTEQGIITAEAIIIATGATPKTLNCPGERDYWGKGVSTCAVCDGILYRDKKVIVVGGGDSAMEAASFLAKFTNKITIVHIRAELSASIPMRERILSNNSTTIIYESTITEISGNGSQVSGVTITHQRTHEQTQLEADGVFIAIGLSPNSGLVRNKLSCDPHGYILCPHGTTETSVAGIFAAGDVVDNRYRQAITAAGEGCKAALDVEHYLSSK
jgi:thioredoxin reductase (NADPH)